MAQSQKASRNAAIVGQSMGLATGGGERLQLIKSELGESSTPPTIESNLAAIVNNLSQEDLSANNIGFQKTPFDVNDKINYNQLSNAASIIEDYKIHHNRLDKIYSTFDQQGASKSISVLDTIRKFYLMSKNNYHGDDLFFQTIEMVIDRVQKSINFTNIPFEELELCASIIVVDSFIRCKIFNNPMDYSNVTP